MYIVIELLNGMPVSASAHDKLHFANKAFEDLLKKRFNAIRQDTLDEHVSNGYYVKNNYSIYIMK